MIQIELDYFLKNNLGTDDIHRLFSYWVPMLHTILGTGDTEWIKVIRSLFYEYMLIGGGGREQNQQIYKKIPDFEKSDE